MTRRIYGLVGTPQSAKTKINELFPKYGIEFINLNAAGNKMRALGSPDRAFFDFIVPGHIFDDGIRRPSYYLDICKNPEKLEAIMKREIPIIEDYAREQIAATTGDVILSWEYLHLLSSEFQFDQVILLICQDEDTWFDRLRFRANERGFPRRLSDRKIKEIIKVHGFRQIIEGSIARWNECLIVDTSPEDFGAENLEFILSNKL